MRTSVSALILLALTVCSAACQGGREEAAKDATPPSTAAAAPTSRAPATESIASVDLCKGVLLTVTADGFSETPLKESIKTGGAFNGAPSWSPDGQRFAIADGVKNALRAINGDGTEAKVLVNGGAEGGVADAHWSPDGSRIAFQQLTPTGVYTIDVINADGTGERKVADGRFVAWSPYGSAIRYTPATTAPGAAQTLLAISLAGDQQPRKLIDIPVSWTYALSADGTKLAYIASIGERRTLPGGMIADPLKGLFLLDTDGQGVPREVLPPEELDPHPLSFSADGTRLAYVALEDKSPGNQARYLEVVNLDGSNKRRLSGDLVHSAGVAQWSPDASQILIYGDALDGLFLVSQDGSGEKKLEVPPDLGCPSEFSARPATDR